jgi:hypothetical protein
MAEGRSAPLYHGASLATLRSARRAAARGDHAAARRYAQQVIDAWASADVEVPAVAEMRALLTKLPPASQPAR